MAASSSAADDRETDRRPEHDRSRTTLAGAGITPANASLYLDLDALLSLDPQGRFFSHDKVEGVAALSSNRLMISNDSDFGISGIANAAPPWQLVPKISPATGKQDDGEYLEVDMDAMPAATSSATVHITEAH